MILMSHLPTQAALLALLGRAKRQSHSAPPQGKDGNVHVAPGAAAHELPAEAPPAEREISPVACTDPMAVHDVAALEEGTLSPTGIHRLEHHLAQCESCSILVAALVDEAQRAEWTETHEAGSRLAVPQK